MNSAASPKKTDRATTFQPGDRVKLWGKNTKGAGIVRDTWFDGLNEMVTVHWERSGNDTEYRAHQLQFAPLA